MDTDLSKPVCTTATVQINDVDEVKNCYVDLRYPQPYYDGNTTYSRATNLYLTEEQLRKIVREEVGKAIEGLGSQIRRRAGVRKTE